MKFRSEQKYVYFNGETCNKPTKGDIKGQIWDADVRI